MRKSISINLSKEKSLDDAIKYLEKLANNIDDVAERTAEETAKRIQERAQELFDKSLFGEVWSGRNGNYTNYPQKAPNVTVKMSKDGNGVITVSIDELDAFFIEFGTGVYHNGSAGASPHAWGYEHGALIGGYGLGLGKRPTWGYRNEEGKNVKTHGTVAQMPMYNAYMEVKDDLEKILEEELRKK